MEEKEENETIVRKGQRANTTVDMNGELKDDVKTTQQQEGRE